MPDLLVHWRHGRRIESVIASDGTVIARDNPPQLPFGAHHPDGTLVASGPSFRSAGMRVKRSIYDIAPTALHLLGQPIPEYFDGLVMTPLLTDEAAKDVARVSEKPRVDDNHRTTSPGDRTVKERLRSLGYME